MIIFSISVSIAAHLKQPNKYWALPFHTKFLIAWINPGKYLVIVRILHHFYLIKEINLSNKPTLFLIDGKLVFDLFFDVIGCCEGLELFGEWTLPRRETLRKNMRESFYNGVLS